MATDLYSRNKALEDEGLIKPDIKVNYTFADDLETRKIALLSYPFLALFEEEKDLPAIYSTTKHEISYRFFPAITKVLPTGSRREGLWVESSDTDYLVECGPLLVHENSNAKNTLTCRPTKNSGFYTVYDEDDRVIHPMVLQIQLSTYLVSFTSSTSILDEMKKQTKSKAALPEQVSGDDKDNVVSLRFATWPEEVNQSMSEQLSKDMLDQVKGN